MSQVLFQFDLSTIAYRRTCCNDVFAKTMYAVADRKSPAEARLCPKGVRPPGV